jgi:hypothetical protein
MHTLMHTLNMHPYTTHQQYTHKYTYTHYAYATRQNVAIHIHSLTSHTHSTHFLSFSLSPLVHTSLKRPGISLRTDAVVLCSAVEDEEEQVDVDDVADEEEELVPREPLLLLLVHS